MLALRLLSEGGEGPNTELVWLLYAGMVFFFLIIIVGWWVSSRKQGQPEVKHEVVKSKKKDVDGGASEKLQDELKSGRKK